MPNLIESGPPRLNAVSTNNYADTREANVPCTVDGYAAEYRIRFNTKEQRLSIYEIVLFQPSTFTWVTIVKWGTVEVGHLNTYPEDDFLMALRGIGEVMWSYANVVVAQSRLRQEELDRNQFASEHMHYQGQLDEYMDERMDVAERLGDDATALVRNEHAAQVEAEYVASAASFDEQVEVLNADR